MDRKFSNIYDDEQRARAYAELGFPGTYYLAFRDLPSIFNRYVTGKKALDFGCGTGRSTGFLRDLGFEVTGVDISSAMLEKAHEFDPDGDNLLVLEGDLGNLREDTFHLVLSAFTFDNIPTLEKKRSALLSLKRHLCKGGRANKTYVQEGERHVTQQAAKSVRPFPEHCSV